MLFFQAALFFRIKAKQMIRILRGDGLKHLKNNTSYTVSQWEKQIRYMTVWKFQNFCITQILREINFVDSRSVKTAFFAILRAANFVHLVNFNLRKVHKFTKIKIQSL